MHTRRIPTEVVTVPSPSINQDGKRFIQFCQLDDFIACISEELATKKENWLLKRWAALRKKNQHVAQLKSTKNDAEAGKHLDEVVEGTE